MKVKTKCIIIFKVFHGNEIAFLCQPHFIMDCKYTLLTTPYTSERQL